MFPEEDATNTARQGRGHAVRQKLQQQIRAVEPYVQMQKLCHIKLLLLLIHNNRLMVRLLSKSNRLYSLATEVPPNPCNYKVKLERLLELSLKKSRLHLTTQGSQEKKTEPQAFSWCRHAKNSLQSQSLRYLQLIRLKQQQGLYLLLRLELRRLPEVSPLHRHLSQWQNNQWRNRQNQLRECCQQYKQNR